MEVPRVDASELTQERLFFEHIVASRPLLITRAHDWPARARWTRDALAAAHGDALVEAAPLPADGHNCWFDDAAAWGLPDGTDPTARAADGGGDGDDDDEALLLAQSTPIIIEALQVPELDDC